MYSEFQLSAYQQVTASATCYIDMGHLEVKINYEDGDISNLKQLLDNDIRSYVYEQAKKLGTEHFIKSKDGYSTRHYTFKYPSSKYFIEVKGIKVILFVKWISHIPSTECVS